MQIYYGPVINPQSTTTYQALPRCLLAVGSAGTIEWIVDDVESALVQESLAQKGCIDTNVEIIELPRGQFIMPGFVDTHTHAPQFPNIGSGQQYELLDWLERVTFPMEAKFDDLAFARRTYETVVRRVIDCGTTTCCYYGTLHLEATKILAEIVHAKGQRAFIGKCNMDSNSPKTYIEPSAADSIQTTRQLISHIRSLPAHAPLVHPIITPRFAIACTPALLTGLGALAASDPTLAIQTHICENTSEIAFTKSLFPACNTYADVYDSFGLLRANTVLAHAVHLEDGEVELIAARQAGISHCPTSNFNLSSGVAPIGKYLDHGIKVGLGTDVSGGFSPSILDSIQNASIAAKVIAMQHAPTHSTDAVPFGKFTGRMLPVSALLHLATLGGAQVCCFEAETGSFAPGKSFDALVVDIRDGLNPSFWGADEDGLVGMLERFFFCGDDRNIAEVYVRGRLIGGRQFGNK